MRGQEKEEKDGDHIRIKPEWRNCGQTPTRHARVNSAWKFFPGPIPDDFDFPDQGTEHHSTVGIGPGQICYSEGVRIPAHTFKLVNNKDTFLGMWGWIEYCDVFGDEPMHRTEFFAVAEVMPAPKTTGVQSPEFTPLFFDVDGLRMAWRSHGKHNGADEDSFRKPKPLAGRRDGTPAGG